MQPKDTFFSRKLTINCGGELLDLSIPKIMGILNVTPDSFYDGMEYSTKEKILYQVDKMIDEGADIIDVGAFSSRPNAKNISLKEESERLYPTLEILRENFHDIIISVDTFRSEIAKKVVGDFNVNIINDISAGELDENMFETMAKLNVPYILMHMQGNPENMQNKPEYSNVIKELITYFSAKVDKLRLIGVKDLIIDLGFGFGKTLDHNYQLLRYLDDFKMFELPILVGVSRKSMINNLLGILPDAALNGTSVLNTLAIINGANILRVHDVKEANEAIKLCHKFLSAKVANWHD